MASAFTGEFVIEDINYYINTNESYAEVRSKEPKYLGDVVIPATIECEIWNIKAISAAS